MRIPHSPQSPDYQGVSIANAMLISFWGPGRRKLASIPKSGPKIKNRCSRVVAFPYKCGSRRRRPFVREGVRESLADLLRQSLTAKGGNRGCWSGCYGRSAAENITDRRASSAFCMDSGIGIVGRPGYHRPKSSTSA